MVSFDCFFNTYRIAFLSRTLIQSTAMVGTLTLLSRILGFVRDAVIASIFGADAVTDAFFVAFRIPNFLRRLFAEGSFSQAFVPVLTRYKQTASRAVLRLFLERTAGSLAAVLAMVTALGVLAAPLMVLCFAPGFMRDPELFTLSAELVRITFPYLFLVTLTAFAGAVLNTFGRFAIPAVTPVFLNLLMIAAALWIAPLLSAPIFALAWAVLVAGGVQLVFQLPFLAKLRLLSRVRWGFGDPDVRRLLRLLGPAMLSASVTQVNVLLNTLLASFLVSGSVSWLYYSDRLVEFPVGLLGVALGTVMLPHLARTYSEADTEHFSRSLDWALRGLLVMTVPATVGLMLLAKPLLYALFQYDQFLPRDVEMTSYSLMTYASGLVGFVAARLLLSGFSARHDYKTPFRFALYAIILNLVLSALLVYLLAPIGWGHAGLALATALAGLTNAGMLLAALRRARVYRPSSGWGAFLGRVTVSAGAMSLLLIHLIPSDQTWQIWISVERIAYLGVLITAGAAGYGGALFASGLRARDLRLSVPPRTGA
ncbi:MAG: murein biosynthesis integral membrane protein MurJ [Methylotetracoccus sp.]|nr:murein biosynthesis integral membrane protein MurJ [Methylotetracoccus sp.]